MTTPTDLHMDLAVVYVADSAAAASLDVRGKVVVTPLQPPPNPPVEGTRRRGLRYTRAAMPVTAGPFLAQGAAAVILIGDDTSDGGFDDLAQGSRRGSLTADTLPEPDHDQRFYFRSDHMPNARANVRAIFFTSTLHDDYHTEREEADTIDYTKLKRVADWMYATGWMVANAKSRPVLDSGFKLER